MDSSKLTRRDFAKTSALAAAAAAAAAFLPAAKLRAQGPEAKDTPKLPAASAAEAEARYQLILVRRGSRLSAAQKTEVRKSVMELQQALDELRAFPLDNADEPALRLVPRPPRGK